MVSNKIRVVYVFWYKNELTKIIIKKEFKSFHNYNIENICLYHIYVSKAFMGGVFFLLTNLFGKERGTE